MKIDKGKLMNAIAKFIGKKKKELAEANKELATYDGRLKDYHARQRKFVVEQIMGARPDKVEATLGTDYRQGYSLELKMSLPKHKVPKDIKEAPENPIQKIEGSSGSYYQRGRYIETKTGLKAEIERAEDQLKLISMSPEDTINVNTKQILDSIKPYLEYV